MDGIFQQFPGFYRVFSDTCYQGEVNTVLPVDFFENLSVSVHVVHLFHDDQRKGFLPFRIDDQGVREPSLQSDGSYPGVFFYLFFKFIEVDSKKALIRIKMVNLYDFRPEFFFDPCYLYLFQSHVRG